MLAYLIAWAKDMLKGLPCKCSVTAQGLQRCKALPDPGTVV